jgi:hypothetical protein
MSSRYLFASKDLHLIGESIQLAAPQIQITGTTSVIGNLAVTSGTISEGGLDVLTTADRHLTDVMSTGATNSTGPLAPITPVALTWVPRVGNPYINTNPGDATHIVVAGVGVVEIQLQMLDPATASSWFIQGLVDGAPFVSDSWSTPVPVVTGTESSHTLQWSFQSLLATPLAFTFNLTGIETVPAGTLSLPTINLIVSFHQASWV